MKYIPIPNEGTCPFLNVSSVLVAPNDPFYITIRSLDFGLESVRVRVLAVVPRWGGGGKRKRRAIPQPQLSHSACSREVRDSLDVVVISVNRSDTTSVSTPAGLFLFPSLVIAAICFVLSLPPGQINPSARLLKL